MDDKNSVWIDREEYERLARLDNQSYAAVGGAIGSASTSQASVGTVQTSPQKKNDTLVTLTAVSAAVSFIFPPLILVFLGLGIATLVRYFSKGNNKKMGIAVGAVAIVGTIAFLVVAGPFLLLIGVIILWQLGCWTGLGSCSTA